MKQEVNQHQHPSERLTRKRNPDTEEFARSIHGVGTGSLHTKALTCPISTCPHRQEDNQESNHQESRSPSEIHVLEGELFSCYKPHILPWLHGCHAARHAEGRGDGREDRDGGLNDEAPYLSFLFIHDFSFRLRVRQMKSFLSFL